MDTATPNVFKRLGAALAAVVLGAGLLAGCSVGQVTLAPKEESSAPQQQAASTPASLPQNGTSQEEERFVMVEITMKDGGVIKLELDREAAPITVDNFVSLVEDEFYDGLTFHRVIEGFMIQGGCPDGNGAGGPGHNIKGEFAINGWDNPIKHTRGVISMARQGDPMYDSAGSQFFIMHQDAPGLDGSYAAFGHVVEGMEVVDAIAETETDARDRPVVTQTISTIRVVD